MEHIAIALYIKITIFTKLREIHVECLMICIEAILSFPPLIFGKFDTTSAQMPNQNPEYLVEGLLIYHGLNFDGSSFIDNRLLS